MHIAICIITSPEREIKQMDAKTADELHRGARNAFSEPVIGRYTLYHVTLYGFKMESF